MLAFLAGTVASGDVNDLLGVGAAIVGLFVAVSRYALVLRGRSKQEIEIATAYGFFMGLAAAAAAVGFLLRTT